MLIENAIHSQQVYDPTDDSIMAEQELCMERLYNLKGKTIIPFATSGGSGMGKTNEKLAPSCLGAKLLHGKVFSATSTKADLSAWVETLNF